MTTYPTPSACCPECGQEHNAATVVAGTDQQPAPGDLTVCIECATPLKFDQELGLVAVTPEDVTALDADAARRLLAAIHVVERIRARRAQH